MSCYIHIRFLKLNTDNVFTENSKSGKRQTNKYFKTTKAYKRCQPLVKKLFLSRHESSYKIVKMKSLAFHIVLSFTLSYLLSIVSVDAVDSLEYIALKRIEKHKKPRIIQVPIYTVRQHQPHIPQESARFPLFVPM